MILYHGSSLAVPQPDLQHSRTNVDFGRGFYTTPLYAQAVSWCRRLKQRKQPGILSRYSFDERALEELHCLQFPAYDAAWIDFVLTCRRGLDTTDYDIVAGGVANDRVFNTVELFFAGLISREEALQRLQYQQPNLQLCFRTEAALARLQFEGSEAV